MERDVEAFLDRIVPEDEPNWNVIRMIVDGYAKRHPEEMAGCFMYVSDLRGKLRDEEFASTSDEALAPSTANTRHVYEMPPALKDAVSMKYPQALKGENLKHFLRLFPGFQIPEKV